MNHNQLLPITLHLRPLIGHETASLMLDIAQNPLSVRQQTPNTHLYIQTNSPACNEISFK